MFLSLDPYTLLLATRLGCDAISVSAGLVEIFSGETIQIVQQFSVGSRSDPLSHLLRR